MPGEAEGAKGLCGGEGGEVVVEDFEACATGFFVPLFSFFFFLFLCDGEIMSGVLFIGVAEIGGGWEDTGQHAYVQDF